jgi:3-hydroxyisobutyrate dehydrogenase-like beta-hydroxyacid dehydrogenase
MTAGSAAPVTVAVLGLGEAGGHLARDLAAAGARVRGFDPAVPAPPGVEPAADDADACRGADLVLSLTTAGEAENALREALAGLDRSTVYADLNSAAAGLKQRLAGLAAQAGVPFADVAIMAPVPPHGLGTPMLASGPAAARVASLLGGCGASVGVLPGPPGTAATRKLLRSVFYKGMAAAIIEALEAARAVGHEQWLREHIADELTEADARSVERIVDDTVRHAVRRTAEMEAAAEMLTELGVPPVMVDASRALHERLSGTRHP